MKSHKSKLILLLAVVLGVVAWSPPSNEDLIVGTTNTVTSPSGFVGVIGTGNNISGRSTLVVGDTNTVTPGLSPGTGYSIVAGTGNTLTGGRNRSIVSGSGNTVNATGSFVSGTTNTLDGPTPGAGTTNSSAIGAGNQIGASHGWTMGYNNEVWGNYGLALGYGNKVLAPSTSGYALGVGLSVNRSIAVALGRYNAPMVSGDVVVVGTGSSDTARSTALRVTSAGGVILGRAQGDISMGAYQ